MTSQAAGQWRAVSKHAVTPGEARAGTGHVQCTVTVQRARNTVAAGLASALGGACVLHTLTLRAEDNAC